MGNQGQVVAEARPTYGRPHTLQVTLPPLGAIWLVPQ
jgi:hypothetical protein